MLCIEAMAERPLPERRRQQMKDRKKIAVLFGGRSPEYKVSLQSAFAVLKSIDQAAYEAVSYTHLLGRGLSYAQDNEQKGAV